VGPDQRLPQPDLGPAARLSLPGDGVRPCPPSRGRTPPLRSAWIPMRRTENFANSRTVPHHKHRQAFRQPARTTRAGPRPAVLNINKPIAGCDETAHDSDGLRVYARVLSFAASRAHGEFRGQNDWGSVCLVLDTIVFTNCTNGNVHFRRYAASSTAAWTSDISALFSSRRLRESGAPRSSGSWRTNSPITTRCCCGPSARGPNARWASRCCGNCCSSCRPRAQCTRSPPGSSAPPSSR
jgi:hypothetical protein